MKVSQIKLQQLQGITTSGHEGTKTLKLLQKVLNNSKAHFKSIDQYNLTMLCQMGKYDIIGRLPCGMGKTEAVIISTLDLKEKYSPQGGRIIVIAILLLVVLIPDYIQRMEQAGLTCEQWDERTSLAQAPDVLIIQLEHLSKIRLWNFLNSISKEEMPHYCVIDEFDAVLDSLYYREGEGIQKMKPVVRNFICLSATATQTHIKSICDILHIEKPFIIYGESQKASLRISLVEATRPPTNQQELVAPEAWETLLPTLHRVIEDKIQSNEGCGLKMIIYPFMKFMNEGVAEFLQQQFPQQKIVQFKTEFNADQKKEVIEEFKDRGNIMLGTEAAATGCNPGRVDSVVILGGVRSMSLLTQMGGRIGRDKSGKGTGELILITSPEWRFIVEQQMKNKSSGSQWEEENLFQIKRFHRGQKCLRQCMGSIDIGETAPCLLFSEIVNCSVCEQQVHMKEKMVRVSQAHVDEESVDYSMEWTESMEKAWRGSYEPKSFDDHPNPKSLEAEKLEGIASHSKKQDPSKSEKGDCNKQALSKNPSYQCQKGSEDEFHFYEEEMDIDWEAMDEIEQLNRKERKEEKNEHTADKGKGKVRVSQGRNNFTVNLLIILNKIMIAN